MKRTGVLFACVAALQAGLVAASESETGIQLALLDASRIEVPIEFADKNGAGCTYSGQIYKQVSVRLFKRTCRNGVGQPVDLIVPLDMSLDHGPFRGQDSFTAYRQGPTPLAIIFMAQIKGVPVGSVTVDVLARTGTTAKVKTLAKDESCEFDVARLPAIPEDWGVVGIHCKTQSE